MKRETAHIVLTSLLMCDHGGFPPKGFGSCPRTFLQGKGFSIFYLAETEKTLD
jgi:hypothetical protein